MNINVILWVAKVLKILLTCKKMKDKKLLRNSETR
jgi:hypothetical protein